MGRKCKYPKGEKFHCHCGCGMEIKPGTSFVLGHQRKGKTLTEEHRSRISKANTGKESSLRGVPRSEETKKKISFSLSGENNPNFGKHPSEETRKKLSISQKGRSVSSKTRQKISITKTGHPTSEETKAKISLTKRGPNNGVLYGGIAFKPYSSGNTEELKEQVRYRDNYTCQECGRIWDGEEKRFAPHHVDYDKSNHIMWNRITLCPSCHSKTVVNREYWPQHFYEMIANICIERILRT